MIKFCFLALVPCGGSRTIELVAISDTGETKGDSVFKGRFKNGGMMLNFENRRGDDFSKVGIGNSVLRCTA